MPSRHLPTGLHLTGATLSGAPPSRRERLRIAEWVVEFEDYTPTPRVSLAAFRTDAPVTQRVRIEKHAEIPASASRTLAELKDGAWIDEDVDGSWRVWAPEPESPVVLAMLACACRSGAVVFHSSAFVLRGKAVLVIAPSGGGKSTLATLAEPLPMLSDEFNVVTASQDLRTWSTPVRSSSPRVPGQVSAPLGAILFPVKAPREELRPVGTASAMQRIVTQVVTPDFWGLKPPFRLVAEIARSVPSYEFHFRKDPACTRLFDELRLAGE